MAASIDNVVEDSRFSGVASVAFVNVVTAVTGLVVRNCSFNNVGTALTKNVVDTVGGSKWSAIGCWDEVGGYGFSGNDAAAVASDDIGTLTTNVGTLQTYANKIDAATLAVSPTAGSLARFIASGGTALGTQLGTSKSIIDALGTNGVAAAAATAASAVSLFGAIGTNEADATTPFTSAAVQSNADGSVLERLEYLQGTALNVRSCEKAGGTVENGDDNLFTITGGPIHILEIAGIVVTGVDAGLTNVKLTLTTDTPAATVDMNAGAVDIDGDVAGTSYRSINTTGIFTPVTIGFVLMANSFATNPTEYFCPTGTIKLNSSAARASARITWYVSYRPLSPNSVVAAAA